MLIEQNLRAGASLSVVVVLAFKELVLVRNGALGWKIKLYVGCAKLCIVRAQTSLTLSVVDQEKRAKKKHPAQCATFAKGPDDPQAMTNRFDANVCQVLQTSTAAVEAIRWES